MKEIELLNKIANGEIRTGFKIKSKNGDIYEYTEGKRHFVNTKDKMYVWTLGDFTKLNDEIEIIEEEKDIERLDDFEKYPRIPKNEFETELMKYIAIHRVKINELIDIVKELKNEKENN